MPGPMGGPRRKAGQEAKAKDFKGTTSKLIKNYLAKYKFLLLIVFIFAVRKCNIYNCWTKNIRKCNNRNI